MTSPVRRVDVLVVGGGPAGIAAASRAAERLGRDRVVLADQGRAPGGQIWRMSILGHEPAAARRWRARLAQSGAAVLPSTAVVDVVRPEGADSGVVALLAASGSADGETPSRIAAHTLVIATGARERFLPFPGWTLPNVVGVGGAQALLESGLSLRGRRVAIAGSGPLVLPVAASLARAGATLVVVAEQAPLRSVASFTASLWRRPGLLLRAAGLRASFLGASYRPGTWIHSVHGDSGVRTATLTNGRATWNVDCDLVCAAFGLVPNTELARLLGCRVEQGHVVANARQETSVPGVYCAGEPTGIGGMERSLAEGEIAGLAAADAAVGAAGVTSIPDRLIARRNAWHRHGEALERAFAPRAELLSLARPDTIVCRCEDVRLGELDRAWSARKAKLYTRAGMGACQGRICGAALESIMGWTVDSVRPPLLPVQLTTLLERDRDEPPV